MPATTVHGENAVKQIVFDIETEPFTSNFQKAMTMRTKRKHAPQMRVACAFDVYRKEYTFYTPRQSPALVRLLLTADEIISFNGKNFDLVVLERHCGLTGRVPRKGKHIDLCEKISERAGFRVSLDLAVRLNFGERKNTCGREMATKSLKNVKVACQSDVSQTHRLYERHVNGTLVIPWKDENRWNGGDEYSYTNVPRECPWCLGKDCLEEISWDLDDMTDGQLSNYLQGMYGSAECQICRRIVDFGF